MIRHTYYKSSSVVLRNYLQYIRNQDTAVEVAGHYLTVLNVGFAEFVWILKNSFTLSPLSCFTVSFCIDDDIFV